MEEREGREGREWRERERTRISSIQRENAKDRE